jgi:hypothetical protein
MWYKYNQDVGWPFALVLKTMEISPKARRYELLRNWWP